MHFKVQIISTMSFLLCAYGIEKSVFRSKVLLGRSIRGLDLERLAMAVKLVCCNLENLCVKCVSRACTSYEIWSSRGSMWGIHIERMCCLHYCIYRKERYFEIMQIHKFLRVTLIYNCITMQTLLNYLLEPSVSEFATSSLIYLNEWSKWFWKFSKSEMPKVENCSVGRMVGPTIKIAFLCMNFMRIAVTIRLRLYNPWKSCYYIRTIIQNLKLQCTFIFWTRKTIPKYIHILYTYHTTDYPLSPISSHHRRKNLNGQDYCFIVNKISFKQEENNLGYF